MTFRLAPRPGVARYAQLASFFRKQIDSGEWPVGKRIPTLEELVQQFKLARTTVRHALGELEADGLLARHRARGTFVTARSPEPRTVPLGTTWEAIAKAHGNAVLRHLGAKPDVVPPCSLDAGERMAASYLFLKRLHKLDGLPHLLGYVYLDQRIAAAVPARRLQSTPMLRLMKERGVAAVKSARQVMTIGTTDLESSEVLGVPIHSPAAIIDRFMFDGSGTLVCYSRGIYRGDQVRLEINLK